MHQQRAKHAGPAGQGGRAAALWEVFSAFLVLGLTSFGGPVAHLGYFRQAFVKKRKWLDEATYGDLMALSQFLPGPASSQTGFALGILRAGPLGGLAAFLGFTLPSAAIMAAFGMGATAIGGPVAAGALHGLALVAVAVVAQAVWGMAQSLAPDRPRAAIALVAVGLVTILGGPGQIAAIAAGALAGLWLCQDGSARATGHLHVAVSRKAGVVALCAFAVLLAAIPVVAAATGDQGLALFDATYRAGALVFGGGHVVLPLLQHSVVMPGWVGTGEFLNGYGLAQAVPGPLFTFAAFLGAAAVPQPNGMAGAAIALVGIFLPGLLLVYGMLPFWDRFRQWAAAGAAMRGTNAAVVGVLGAALYDPVFVSAVRSRPDFVLALVGFLLLTVWRMPSWAVVLLLAGIGALGGVVG